MAMSETMGVVVELWPLAADELGIWMLASDARRSAPVLADSDPHFELEMMLTEQGVGIPALIHSTSWRPDGPHIVLTYVAVVSCDGLVRDDHPDAMPVSPELLPMVGNPLPHGATEVPLPRYVDVLHHALQHLAWLMDYNAEARDVLTGHWRQHLSVMSPALAGMYLHRGE